MMDTLTVPIALIAVAAMCVMRMAGSKTQARKVFYSFISAFAIVGLCGYGVAYYQNYTQITNNAVVLSTNGPATNTIYQNINYTKLVIYSWSTGTLRAWTGNSVNTLTLAVVDTPSIATGIQDGNVPATLIVPLNWYYKYNYTPATNFTLEGFK